MNIAHEIDSMQLLSKLSAMNAGQKDSSLTPKSAKAAICDVATLLTRCVCS